MTVFGVCMVKDEADVIEGTIRHMAGEVDRIIVADNGSTDGTRDILATLATELDVKVYDDPDPAYYQSRKMTGLAEMAAGWDATWIVPFDADELWIAEQRLADALIASEADVAPARLFNHFATAIDPADPDPFRQIIWRQADPAPLPKVAFRWKPGAVIHQGNHGVTLPDEGSTDPTLLSIRHFPYRSAAQFVSKARNGSAAYKATDLNVSEGAHWRAYGDLLERHGVETLESVYREHFWFLSPTDSGLIRDPAPYMRWA